MKFIGRYRFVAFSGRYVQYLRKLQISILDSVCSFFYDIPSHRKFFFRWSFYYTARCETHRDYWEIILHVLCHRWRTAQSHNESRRVAQQPFKPPMNFSVINYDSGKCIGEYLRMFDNLKCNLGGFWHFSISFHEYYCRFKA
jgi:hypothetical protein